MSYTEGQHSNAIGQYNTEQDIFVPDNFYPRLFAQVQSQNTYAQTMAQPAFERRPGRNVHGQTWLSQHTVPQGSQYPHASAAAVFNNVAAPTQQAMWGHNETTYNTRPWHTGLLTTPLTMQGDSRDEPNSHLVYSDGNLNGQNTMSKDAAHIYGGSLYWPFSATGNLQQQVSSFGGSETATNLSSSSPPSFFSASPPHQGPAFRDGELTGERSTSNMRERFIPVHPDDVKQPDSPLQTRPAAVNFDPDQASQLDIMGARGTMPFVSQNTVPWLSGFATQTGLPYYQSSRMPLLSYRQSANDNSSASYSAADSDLSYLSQRSDAQRGVSTQDQYHTGKTAEDQTQRKEQDRLLLEGKAQGLTYKQIRANMDDPVAESTLRGRYRSLVKPRHARVRKPVWKEKDLQLLKDSVLRELKRLEDDGRALDAGQRLQKVPWKKVADHIFEKGGSYHFGNATCKKKWGEISSRTDGR